MFERISKQIVNMIAGTALLVSAILFIATFQRTTLTAQSPDTVVEPAAPLAVSQVLNYQGRLLSPSTGLPKADGDYQMVFSIYNVATGGSPLWTETQSVPVSGGFFSALLGSVTVLNGAHFNGQELFLGVTMAGDPEMTPRQRLAHSAYAMFAERAGAATTAVNATNATNAVNATTATNATNAGNAGTLDNLDSTAFAAASHNHSGAAINSGTVAEARIDGAIARDNEIVPAVLAADGSGSGLDADMLDGLNSGSFAAASHNHSGAAINSGTVAEVRIDGAIARDSEIFPTVLAADGSGSGLNADTLDGVDFSSFYLKSEGTQINGTGLGVGGTHLWSTHSWSPNDRVLWEAIPTTAGGQVRLTVSVKLENGLSTYIFSVFNDGSITTDYSIRYAILQ